MRGGVPASRGSPAQPPPEAMLISEAGRTSQPGIASAPRVQPPPRSETPLFESPLFLFREEFRERRACLRGTNPRDPPIVAGILQAALRLASRRRPGGIHSSRRGWGRRNRQGTERPPRTHSLPRAVRWCWTRRSRPRRTRRTRGVARRSRRARLPRCPPRGRPCRLPPRSRVGSRPVKAHRAFRTASRRLRARTFRCSRAANRPAGPSAPTRPNPSPLRTCGALPKWPRGSRVAIAPCWLLSHQRSRQ
mmetsp:Transcript_43302/g.106947  ORF Transcript_43302/g.106947 Transcript_43302/m.106947 type:complete len:249 (+) Transcript_43302:3827-4573(+)